MPTKNKFKINTNNYQVRKTFLLMNVNEPLKILRCFIEPCFFNI